MPAKNPRVQVTLPSDIHETVHSLANLRGESMSSVVREMLELMHPTLARTVEILRSLEAKQRRLSEEGDGQFNAMKVRALTSVEDAEKAIKPGLDAIEEMLSFLGQQSGLPPHSNTGVTPQVGTATETSTSKGQVLDLKGYSGRKGGSRNED